MNYFAVMALVNALTTTGLGILVYLKSNKEKLHLVFVLFCATWAFWSFSYFAWQMSSNVHEALFWSRSLMRGSVFIPVTFLHFILIFINEIKKHKAILILAYLQSFFFLLASFTPYYVSHVEPSLFFPFWPKPGVLFHPFLFIWTLIMAYNLFLLLSSYRKTYDRKRQQIKYIIIGMVIGVFGGYSNYLLWYDIPVAPYLNFSSTVYVGIIAYVILRYRLFGIKIILNKIAVYIFTVISMAVFLYTFYLLQKNIYEAHPFVLIFIAVLFFSIIFTPLYKLFAKLSNQVFYGGDNPYENINEIISRLNQSADLNSFYNALVKELADTFQTVNIDLLVFLDEEFINFKSMSVKNYTRPIIDKLTAFFNIYRTSIIKDEITEFNKKYNIRKDQISIFNRTDSHIITPIYYQNNLVAILFLGKRGKKKMYNQEDIIFIEKISFGVSTCLQNIKINHVLDFYINKNRD